MLQRIRENKRIYWSAKGLLHHYLERRDPDFERKMAEVLIVYSDVNLYQVVSERRTVPARHRSAPSAWTRTLAYKRWGRRHRTGHQKPWFASYWTTTARTFPKRRWCI